MESLLGREVGKDARMLIILLKVYLQVLTSEFFQSITKLNISEAVNILIGIQVDHSLYFLPFIVEAGQKELPFPHHQ